MTASELTSCDREPIHIPGSIQPHGLLFALEGAALRIRAASANVGAHFGRSAQEMLGTQIGEFVDQACVNALRQALGAATKQDSQSAAAATRLRITSIRLRSDRQDFGGDAELHPPGPPLRALVHPTAEGPILEIELLHAQASDVPGLFDSFEGAARRLQQAGNTQEVCAQLAIEIRSLTNYDRVKIYRFATDWSGEVLAESNCGELPSYLGLNFPASDIPVQARSLYERNPERQIPDAAYRPVPLLQSAGPPIDLGQAALRSVSPVHLEYLRNMGVGASMSVSILRRGVLWGLIACHHRSAHYVAPEQRQAAVMLAQLASWQLMLLEEAQSARRTIGVKAVEKALLQESTAGTDYREALVRHAGELLTLLGAQGLAVSSGGAVTTIGKTPDAASLDDLLDWLAHPPAGSRAMDGTAAPLPGGLFATDRLSVDYPRWTGLDNAAGILAVPLGGPPRNLMVWFRPELIQTVSWGGEPLKAAQPQPGVQPMPGADPGSAVELHPRRSFDRWTESVRGRSKPWTTDELEAANGLRDMIVDIIVRRAHDLERINALLLQSNEELEAFAYVASHDLKEPLRQIETFGTLLERVFDARGTALPASTEAWPPANVGRWFEGIQASSRRLRLLINDLAEYSRLGLRANAFAPCSLDALLTEVEADFAQLIEETGATIEADPLPVLMCDAVQLRQLLQNLLSNALKYRHPARAPAVSIKSRLIAGTASEARPLLELTVSDNGIGFDLRHRERIFEPFQRLHSSDAYEGSGIGLAICRKVASRHGGTIEATAQPGSGAVFKVTLPMRPLSAAAIVRDGAR